MQILPTECRVIPPNVAIDDVELVIRVELDCSTKILPYVGMREDNAAGSPLLHYPCHSMEAGAANADIGKRRLGATSTHNHSCLGIDTVDDSDFLVDLRGEVGKLDSLAVVRDLVGSGLLVFIRWH